MILQIPPCRFRNLGFGTGNLKDLFPSDWASPSRWHQGIELGIGNLLLGAWNWEFETRNLELGTWCRVPGAGCRVPGAGCRVPDCTLILTSCQVIFILYLKRVNFRLSCPPDGTTAKWRIAWLPFCPWKKLLHSRFATESWPQKAKSRFSIATI